MNDHVPPSAKHVARFGQAIPVTTQKDRFRKYRQATHIYPGLLIAASKPESSSGEPRRSVHLHKLLMETR